MSDEIQPHVLALYKPIKKIGSGAYGIVWKVMDRKTKQLKALKKNFDAFTNSTDAQRTYRQIMFLKQLKQQNIIQLDKIIRACNDKDIYLIFEHMDIDLHTLIRQNSNNQHLQQKHKQYIIYQLSKSILYLHNSDIIHRDLKPSNVLVNQNCQAKLCDFGLVRSLEEPVDQEILVMTDYIATRWYRAPELLFGCKDYNKEIDIWALGCVVGEMVRGKPMFPGSSTINQIQRILNWTGTPNPNQIKNLKANINKGAFDLLTAKKKSHKNDYFPHIDPNCMDLIKRMLQFDPSKRIDILSVLEHPYLAEFYNRKEIQEICRQRVSLRLHINDNVKLSLKNYRSLIYSQIEEQQSPKGQYQFIKVPKSSHNTIHPNNHIKKPTIQQQRKSSLQKDKTQKRFKTQTPIPQALPFPSSTYSTSNNLKTASSKKYPLFKDPKLLSSKKTIPRQTTTSLQKKKGISLCSKEVSSTYSKVKEVQSLSKPNSVYNTSCYPLYTEESQEKKRSTKLGHYKKVKIAYKNSLEKDAGKNASLTHYEKNKKLSTGISTIHNGWFINQNIGRKDSFN